jgi:hypothetical protein
MKFNSGEDSIVNNILDELDIVQEEYPIAKMTRAVNRGITRLWNIALSSDRNAQVDDTRWGTDNIFLVDLASGQRKYSIIQDEDLANITNLLTVSISDEGGNWRDLEMVDIRDEHKAKGLRWRDTSDATPMVVDWHGGNLFVDPAPDYNKTDGMRLYIQREAKLFLSTDTDVEIGFASQHHEYLVLYACERWLRPRDEQRYAVYKRERMEMEQGVIEFYGNRDSTGNEVMTSGDPNPF